MKHPLNDPEYLKNMLEAYIECALWSSLDEGYGEEDSCAGNLDANYGPEDLTTTCRLVMQAECAAFLADAQVPLEGVDLEPGQVGHDFWLTRNGHGAGFWDRGLGLLGVNLTDAAKAYGTFEIYADVGKVSNY